MERTHTVLNTPDAAQRFRGLSELLDEYPYLVDKLLIISIDSFLELTDEELEENIPLLQGLLRKYSKLIKFEDLYKHFQMFNQQNIMHYFVSHFEEDLTVLPYAAELNLPLEIVINLFKKTDEFIPSLLLHYPSLSVVAYQKFMDRTAPFILAILDRLSQEELEELAVLVKGTATLLEIEVLHRLSKPVIPSLRHNPFSRLELHRLYKDEESAYKLASVLGIEDEMRIDGQISDSTIDKLGNAGMLTKFSKSLSEAKQGQYYKDFEAVSRKICSRIETESMQLHKDLKEKKEKVVTNLFTQLPQQQRPRRPICRGCYKYIAKHTGMMYQCNHCFHYACIERMRAQLKEVHKDNLFMAMSEEDECPICGVNSSALVFIPLADERDKEWELKLEIDQEV